MITIKLNGEDYSLDSSASLPELLETLELAGKPVVVERNKIAIFPRDYTSVCIEDGDRLEIITIAAGG